MIVRFRLLRQHPALCGCAALNIAAFVSLASGLAGVTRDLFGAGLFEWSGRMLEVFSAEGWSRQRFSLWEFERLRATALKLGVGIGAVGRAEVSLGAPLPQQLRTPACYVSDELLNKLTLLAGAPDRAPGTATGDDSHPLIVTEPMWRRLGKGKPVELGSTLLLNGREGQVKGVAGANVASPAGCPGSILLRLDDLIYFSPTASVLFAPETQWLTVWLFPGGKGAAGRSEFVRSALQGTLGLRRGEWLRLTPSWLGVMTRMREVLVPLTLLAVAALVFSVLTAFNAYVLMTTVLAISERDLAVQIALGASMARILGEQLANLFPALVAGILLGMRLAAALLVRASTLGAELGADISTERGLVISGVVIGIASVLVIVGSVLALRRWLSVPRLVLVRNPPMPRLGGSVKRHLLLLAELSVCSCGIAVSVGLVLSVRYLRAVSPNFDVGNVISLQRVEPQTEQFGLNDAKAVYSLLGAEPGVRCYSYMRVVPFSGRKEIVPVSEASGKTVTSEYNEVGADILCALGVPLRSGRDFEWSDERQKYRVALISRSAAEALFGSGGIGERILIGTGQQPHLVVGLFEDPKFNTLREAGTRHVWVLGGLSGDMDFVVRALPGHAAEVADRLLRAVGGYRVERMSQALAQWVRPGETLGWLLTFACAVVFATTLVSLLTVAWEESERKRPVAALLASFGAPRLSIAALMGGRMCWEMLIGTTAGAAAGYAIMAHWRPLLFGVHPHWVAIGAWAATSAAFGLAVIVRLMLASRPAQGLLRGVA
ncbi:MAG TPA: ABC transporter permease [Bryobacteraceae bacterium]|nr:ABC transporter permease [Bryobacteraceae bacterium]